MPKTDIDTAYYSKWSHQKIKHNQKIKSDKRNKEQEADMERSAATKKTKAYTNTYRLLEGKEAMTNPTARRAISTDVRKAFLMVSVWGTERHLLYRLVNNKALKKWQWHQQIATTSIAAGTMYYTRKVLLWK